MPEAEQAPSRDLLNGPGKRCGCGSPSCCGKPPVDPERPKT